MIGCAVFSNAFARGELVKVAVKGAYAGNSDWVVILPKFITLYCPNPTTELTFFIKYTTNDINKAKVMDEMCGTPTQRQGFIEYVYSFPLKTGVVSGYQGHPNTGTAGKKDCYINICHATFHYVDKSTNKIVETTEGFIAGDDCISRNETECNHDPK